MRPFALTTAFAIGLVNCFQAYSGQYLSSQVRQFAADHQTKLSYFSICALAVPPWFYLLAVIAIVIGLLGLSRKLSDSAVVFSAVGLLLLDVVALLVMLWGVGVLLFPFYDRIA